MENSLNSIIKDIFSQVVKEELNNFVFEVRKQDSIPEILTLHEAAIFIRTSDDWIRRNSETYRIPYFKTGSDYKFRKKQLLEWVDDNISILSKSKTRKIN